MRLTILLLLALAAALAKRDRVEAQAGALQPAHPSHYVEPVVSASRASPRPQAVQPSSNASNVTRQRKSTSARGEGRGGSATEDFSGAAPNLSLDAAPNRRPGHDHAPPAQTRERSPRFAELQEGARQFGSIEPALWVVGIGAGDGVASARPCWHDACTNSGMFMTIVFAFAFFAGVLVSSRVLSPLLAPATYGALRLRHGQRGYWDASVASTVHALIICTLAAIAVADEPAFLSSSDAFLRTSASCRTLSVFFAWVVLDLGSSLYYWGSWEQDGWPVLIHHFSAVACWALFLQGGYGHAIALIGAACELTNPFMNMRYFLSTAGHKRSTAYLLNGALFLASFLLVRVGFATAAGSSLLWKQRDTLRLLPTWRHVALVLFFIVGCALNWMWAHRLLRGAWAVLRAGAGAPPSKDAK